MSKFSNECRWVPTLYFAEGIPYAIVNTVAVILYKRMEVPNEYVAFLTSWLYFPWVVKALWSPFVDIISTKRHWIIVMQCLLALSFASVGLLLPGPEFLMSTITVFWLMAFFSATHDIAADGFYMLGLSPHSQSVWVGLRSAFYRLAMLAGQGGVVYMAGLFEERMSVNEAWKLTFIILSLLFLALMIWHTFALPHPDSDRQTSGAKRRTALDILREFRETFILFFRKKYILAAMAFMLLYKLPEAMLVKMIAPFLLDPPEAGGLGMSTADVGVTYGTLGIAGLMAGGILGGFVAARDGLRRWLMPMAWSMSLTCATFLLLSVVDSPSRLLIDCCVVVEQFGYGFGSTAYVLYLLYFSEGERQTSNYAICTGFMALGMMFPGMVSGWLETSVGYTIFFVITLVCCAATLVSGKIVTVPPTFGKKSD